MFGNITGLLLVLLLINLVPEGGWGSYPFAPSLALGLGLVLFVVTLSLIVLQAFVLNRRQLLYYLTHAEFLSFLAIYHFVLGADRVYPSQLLIALTDLTFYFTALFVYNLATSKQWRVALADLRFTLPFSIPFLLLQGLIDLVSLLGEVAGVLPLLVLLCGGMGCFVGITLLFPFLLQWAWGCRPLAEGHLKKRLDALCARVGFRHGGLLTWPALPRSVTAGIVGILPSLRYVLFTEPLLRGLSADEVESILAHEMGHSRHRHLMLYPCLLFGLFVLLTLFDHFVEVSLKDESGRLWQPLLFYAGYAFIMLLYVRGIFGLFSRAFERQADLFPLELGLEPEHVIGALDRVAVLSGHIHRRPSWHHYSIAQRMTFLRQAVADPALIRRHHLRVKGLLGGYLVVLVALFVLAWSAV